ncbi:MAG: thioredoxin domain-containing protein [Mucilaginibacter sp.]
MTPNNITAVLTRFIVALNIPLTRKSIDDELQRHPDYNSLLAFSDLLNNWRVPNASYQLTYDEILANEVPAPFIVHFKDKQFAVVESIDTEKVIVSNEKWNKHTMKIDAFKGLYGDALLLAEKEATSGEEEYNKKHRKEILDNMRVPFVVGGSAVILLILLLNSHYLHSFNWQISLLTLFKTAGIATSIMLLVQSIDANNPLIRKLCGGDNNKDCNAILSSKAAKISDDLSWSEVGFFYFTGTWLVLLFNSNNSNVLHLLALLNLVGLPYTFYSIYYQWRMAKQWCMFCCTVQALLWLEFFAFLPSLATGFQSINLMECAQFIMEMAIPILIWVFIKPYLLLSKQIQPLKQQLRTFKYNTELFNKLLNEEIKYTLPPQEHSIILGNREAEKVITMVSNPYCQPCAKAHKSLDEWLKDRDDIKLQIIFFVNNENDPKLKVAEHLLSLQANHDDISLKKAVDDWYEQKQRDFDTWSKKHSNIKSIPTDESIAIQRDWCNLTDIKATPTLFINGRKLSENYQPEDLKYFL